MAARRLTALAVLALALAGLSACGPGTAESTEPMTSEGSSALLPSPAPISSTASTASPTPEFVAPDPVAAHNAAAFAAVLVAEEAANGIAVSLTWDDDTWEVDVAAQEVLHQFVVSPDGRRIVAEKVKDADSDDMNRWADIRVRIPTALELALTHLDGEIHEAKIEKERGTPVWQVKIDAPKGDEFRVDALTGEIVN